MTYWFLAGDNNIWKSCNFGFLADLHSRFYLFPVCLIFCTYFACSIEALDPGLESGPMKRISSGDCEKTHLSIVLIQQIVRRRKAWTTHNTSGIANFSTSSSFSALSCICSPWPGGELVVCECDQSVLSFGWAHGFVNVKRVFCH